MRLRRRPHSSGSLSLPLEPEASPAPDWATTGWGGGILPEPGTDFIFALVGEQLGLVGTLSVVFLFGLLFYRGMLVAKRAPDFAGRMLALGFTLSIAIEAVFNMGVATGLMPTKGIPLPFMSFGGSSLLANALGVGIILSVSRFSRSAPSPKSDPSQPEAVHES